MNMRNTEGPPQGGQRLNMARTGEGGGGIITPKNEMAPPPTNEQIELANAGKLVPGRIEKTILDAAKKHPLAVGFGALAIAGGACVAVQATQDNIPGIHRSVESPSSFDNSAKEQTITDRNSHFVTLEQFKAMDTPSSYDPDTQTFTYVLPFAVPEGIDVEYKKLSAGNTIGPDTPLYHEKIGFLDIDGRPAVGVDVVMFDEGWNVLVKKGYADLGQDPNYAGAITFLKYLPEQDVTVNILIMDPSTSLKSNVTMMDHSEVKQLSMSDYFNKLPSPPKSTLIASTTDKTQQPLLTEIRVYRGNTLRSSESELIQNADPNLLTDILNNVLVVKNK
jgi:hypothetical protein